MFSHDKNSLPYPLDTEIIKDDTIIGCSDSEESDEDTLNTAFIKECSDTTSSIDVEIQYNPIMSDKDWAVYSKIGKLYELLQNDVILAFRSKTEKKKPRSILTKDTARFLRYFRSPYGEYWVKQIMFDLMVTKRQGPGHSPYYHNIEFDGKFYKITICKCPLPEKK